MRLLIAAILAGVSCFCQGQVMRRGEGIPTVATPTDAPGAGTYGSTQSVTLSDPGSALIHYTVDGSTPSFIAGTLYTGAFNIAATSTLKAIGCAMDGVCGGVLTSVYTISAGITYVRYTSNTDGGGYGTLVTTLSAAPTAGNLLVAFVYNSNGASLPTDSSSQTWQTLNASDTRGIYYIASTAAITSVSEVSGYGLVAITIAEFSGVGTLDKIVALADRGYSASWTTANTATTTAANELLVGYATQAGGFPTTSAPWTAIDSVRAPSSAYMLSGYRIVASATAYAFAGAGGNGNGITAAIGTFK